MKLADIDRQQREASVAARRAAILSAVEKARGDIDTAAKALGIKRRALYTAIDTLDLGAEVGALRDRLHWTPKPGRRLGGGA